jgi:hypothetical protein
MANINKIIEILTKKISVNANTICVVEKMGNAFYFHSITKELCSLIHVEPELIVNKVIEEILPLDLSNKISKYYHEAWNTGKEVFYKLDFPFGNNTTLYKVLSPVVVNGEVIRLHSHCVSIDQIPVSLRVA